jgi:hypothetical protein
VYAVFNRRSCATGFGGGAGSAGFAVAGAGGFAVVAGGFVVGAVGRWGAGLSRRALSRLRLQNGDAERNR